MISTSKLAEKLNVRAGALFQALEKYEFIVKEDEFWALTEIGKAQGGHYKESKQYGRYIVWPEDLYVPLYDPKADKLTAAQIGERLKLTSQQSNQLLGELGWILKSDGGWIASTLGKRMGAEQRHNKTSHIDYVVWDKSIIVNTRLLSSAEELLGCHVSQRSTDKSYSNFRQKFEAKFHCADGHYVRTTEEMHLDNWLYLTGIAHAYARRLPIDKDIQSSFYLPRVNLYLEIRMNDMNVELKTEFERKIQTYQQYGLAVVIISVEDLENLDKSMPLLFANIGITMSQVKGKK
ncbi:glycerol kinase [Vibrio sp. S9_S30]|uniref:glycerol kinase n=1 Tax=Vibrio sp. S9_S30 TaxID=2720226 RepID=UPI00168150AB|nr:glycerol kinase [Vibrio sp. S9_S30]MBD1556786.1 glycerol kinase [Vibrio sp. S9_S30]